MTRRLTHRFLDYFVAEDADGAWIEESLAFDAQVGAEDRMLIERVQAGMRAGLIAEGRLLPESGSSSSRTSRASSCTRGGGRLSSGPISDWLTPRARGSASSR